ncbi:MAG: hypothetical protein H0X34_03360 [Chthoniobacterales bacterium]|nr:hypothetical protein [Chthoniobacterales bacterium]
MSLTTISTATNSVILSGRSAAKDLSIQLWRRSATRTRTTPVRSLAVGAARDDIFFASAGVSATSPSILPNESLTK